MATSILTTKKNRYKAMKDCNNLHKKERQQKPTPSYLNRLRMT